MTALALWYFAREKVEWVVWETGLGGRLDATNIVQPEVCIITNIGLDHQQFLGQSLGEIAAEKAGIIKPGVPVISAVEAGEGRDVIERIAHEKGSKLTLIPDDLAVRELGLWQGRQQARIGNEEFSLGLIGAHQVQNAACAVATLRQLPATPLISTEVIAQGLEKTVWSGRFEILSETPLMVLDGAHNPAGMRRLVETWRAFLASRGHSEQRTHVVFASVSDKDITEMAQLLLPLAGEISLVRLANERSFAPAQMAPFFSGLRPTCHESVTDLWRDLASTGSPKLPTLLTGSLFLVGEVLAQRQGNTEEYRLNERLGTALTR